MNKTRIFLLSLLSALLLPLFVGCGSEAPAAYTLRTAVTEPVSSLSFAARQGEMAEALAALLTSGFARETEHGWEYEMALCIDDITAEFSEREVWQITETAGRVFCIQLDPLACWDDGTPIDADSYVASLYALLNAETVGDTAQAFLSSDLAPVHTAAYLRAGHAIYAPVVSPYAAGETGDYGMDLAETDVYLSLTGHEMTLSSAYSIAELCELGYVDSALYSRLAAQENRSGYVPVTEENAADVREIAEDVLAFYGLLYTEDAYKELLFYDTGASYPLVAASDVGLYATDTYELIYITETAATAEEFFRFTEKLWLLYDPEKPDSVRSYGAYALSLQSRTHITLEKNMRWLGYRADEDDALYQSTAIDVAIVEEVDEAIRLFSRGELDLVWLDAETAAEWADSAYLTACTEDRFLLVSPRIHAPQESLSPDVSRTLVGSIRYLYDDTAWARYVKVRGGCIDILPTDTIIQKTESQA